ncbi:DUF6233 domain-containing protein [Streptomyces sp. NPDC059957]|uniref:DUF6233 domain-containing protein n=1 Tax=Streptomyces sp. NPDC059957 TaxID=3347016 RepID=UPI00365EDFEC
MVREIFAGQRLDDQAFDTGYVGPRLQPREALEASRRPPKEAPAWLVERGIGAGRLPARVHTGDCWDTGHRCAPVALYARTGFWHRSWGAVAERYPMFDCEESGSRETAYALLPNSQS